MNDNEKSNVHEIDHPCFTKDQLREYILNNSYDENMFKDDGSLNSKYNSYKKTGIISQIFEDHWDKIDSETKNLILKYRPNAEKEVNKIIACHNKSLGASVYECPKCHDMIFVGHTCKSRLCTSCGYKYKLERVENILNTCYNCKHRQIVFTIAEELRPYFFCNFEEMINILFDAVTKTIYSLLNETYKKTKSSKTKKKYKIKAKYTPGFIEFLHTFGRDIKWNPHIHVLIAEIKLGGDKVYKDWNYFDYNALSKRFQKILLDLMSEKLGKSFNEMRRSSYINHKNGFYVYAEPKKFPNLKKGIEYVSRYCGRPAISENRILNYDGEFVTFCYNDHVDESYHEVKVTAIEFIKMLMRHLLPSNFKAIRYCGFYRRKHKNHNLMNKLINPAKKAIRKQFMTYKMNILKFFNRNPYECPKCGTTMNYAFELLSSEGG